MGDSPRSSSEALALLEQITLLAAAAGVPALQLKNSSDALQVFLTSLPTKEEELRERRDIFTAGAEAQLRELLEVTYHPQSTGLRNPYEDELQTLREDQARLAEGWFPAASIFAEDFEVPEGMKLEWDSTHWLYRRWGRIVPVE
jgi:hypothetical protein